MKQNVISYFIRNLLISMVRAYQKTFSALSVGACRYYPSCSEYTLWLLRFDSIICALGKSLLRILRCNQFFEGGIAYPIVTIEIRNIVFAPKNIKYWFVPYENLIFLDIMTLSKKTYKIRFYIIKSILKGK